MIQMSGTQQLVYFTELMDEVADTVCEKMSARS